MSRITATCPFCDSTVQALMPKDSSGGRFLISCSSCEKDICLTLDTHEDRDAEIEPERALARVERRDPEAHTRKRRRKRRKVRKSFRRHTDGAPASHAITMEVFPERSPVMMEPDQVRSREDSGNTRPSGISKVPKRSERGSADTDDTDIYEEVEAIPEGKTIEGRRDVLKRILRERRKRIRAFSAGLFFTAFLIGMLYLTAIPLYSEAPGDPGGSGDRDYVNIMGTVFVADENRTVLEGVEIVIKGEGRTTETNAEGHYYFANIGEGSHTITARKKGFTTQSKKITFIGNRAGSNINFQLKPGTGSDVTDMTTTSHGEERSFNSFFGIVVAASVCALAAGVSTIYSKRFFPTFVLGLAGIASGGFFFLASIVSFAGVLLFVASSREF